MSLPAAEITQDAINRAETYSPFLRGLIKKFPEAIRLPSSQFEIGNGDGSLPRRLRLAKSQLALQLALADLSGALTLEEVTGLLTDFADLALELAIEDAILAHVPGSAPRGFAALALGKQGGFGLNYSSDIDLIFLYDPKTLPHRSREDVAESAVRIGRRVIETLQSRNEHGYVFRVDLRLRPTPEVTPIALPVDEAIRHYESSALFWERAAFIRARAASGDTALGQSFLDTIAPFVWRHSLDFGLVGEMQSITQRIRDHYARSQQFGPGFDLKRGRGGIRDIEFFTQIHQLIHGGKDSSLRSGNTMTALGALVRAGHVSTQDNNVLSPAYRGLRTIEHRLQMVDDRQTHTLPENPTELDNVANLHGLRNGKALLALLQPHVAAVSSLGDALYATPTLPSLPVNPKDLERELAEIGHQDASFLAERIAFWRSAVLRPLRSEAAQHAFEAVLPRLAKGFANARDSRTAIVQFETLLERLPSAVNLFRLLEARPQLLALLLDVLCLTPALALSLARRTDLLDGLIDASALVLPGSVAELTSRFAHTEASLETRLDQVRRNNGELRFALGVQLMTCANDPISIAKGYARVAEAAILTVADAVIADFKLRHGSVPKTELVILALGRLGGGELTPSSDLDLIYVFTGKHGDRSDGDHPLGATHYYSRLAQRITSGLSVATAAGPLYAVDTRLRPFGSDGLIAVSMSSFKRYLREDAWTWERLALTRARPVYGSNAARAAAQQVVDASIALRQDRAKLITDAAEMRQEIAAHKPPSGRLDVKLLPGGLVDLEFCVAVCQLLGPAGRSPDLAISLSQLVSKGQLPKELVGAHKILSRVLMMTRLIDLDAPDAATELLVAQACGAADWETLLDQCDAARLSVEKRWKHFIGED